MATEPSAVDTAAPCLHVVGESSKMLAVHGFGLVPSISRTGNC